MKYEEDERGRKQSGSREQQRVRGCRGERERERKGESEVCGIAFSASVIVTVFALWIAEPATEHSQKREQQRVRGRRGDPHDICSIACLYSLKGSFVRL